MALLTASLSWQQRMHEIAMTEHEQNMAEMNGLGSGCESVKCSREKVVKIKRGARECVRESKPPQKQKIYFCSRTHSQLQQVVDELRNCHCGYTENMSMAILGSRMNLCVNSKARDRAELANRSVDEICRELQDDSACSYFHKMGSVVEELQKSSIWDIEDAARIGRKLKGCPYYASRQCLAEASFVLAPYNFLLDRSIRKTLDIDLQDAVLIFDEAHNIEDFSRSAASTSISKKTLTLAVAQLKTLAEGSGITSFRSLHELSFNLLEWFERMSGALTEEDMKSGANVWGGEEILETFDSVFGLNGNTLEVYSEHLNSVLADNDDIARLLEEGDSDPSSVKIGYEDEAGGGLHTGPPKLAASISFFLKDLFKVLQYMYENNQVNSKCYKVLIDKGGDRRTRAELCLNFFCLDSSVVFTELNVAHSILLASGTLSPLDSFEGELGIPFPVKVEASHVIDLTRQVFATSLSCCEGVQYNSTYSNQNSMEYVDAVGKTVVTVAKASPGGTLVFLSSYASLDKMHSRWQASGILIDLDNTEIEIFIEPKTAKELETVLEEYYDRIDNGNRGILLAVLRGKVSEGINFTDAYARAVLIVGIPYPNTKDTLVQLKREYQDYVSRSNSVCIDGKTWYTQQAFRAINQAVGRCLRHRRDYGAIFLCDYRFAHSSSTNKMSKWIRNSLHVRHSMEDIVLPMIDFFRIAGNYSALQIDCETI